MRITLPIIFLGALLLVAGTTAQATPYSEGGVFSTDRFGYTGVLVRYASLEDYQNSVVADTILIEDVPGDDSREHRDAAFYFVDNAGAYDIDMNILMGSWWYTIQGSAGYGNINGNTGIGFMQLYDDDGSTDTSVSMGFGNFDGSYWTDYTLQVTGTDAGAADTSRLSAYNNTQDAGTYLEYALDITATGLQGVQTGNVIEANDHPDGVMGTFTALFAPGGDPQGDLFPGSVYAVSLTFDMENWAWSQQPNLNGEYHNGGNIYDSQFVEVVPEPVTLLMLGGLGAGMAAARRLRRRKA